MGTINLKGVIIGGLVAGLVLNVVDYIFWGVIFARDFEAALQAIGKGPSDSMVPIFVLLDFLYGIALVYLYAAIRPRFGPGARTAVYAGLIMWVVVGLLHTIGEAPIGFFPMRLYVIGTIVGLVLIPLAAVAGARFYTEPA